MHFETKKTQHAAKKPIKIIHSNMNFCLSHQPRHNSPNIIIIIWFHQTASDKLYSDYDEPENHPAAGFRHWHVNLKTGYQNPRIYRSVLSKNRLEKLRSSRKSTFLEIFENHGSSATLSLSLFGVLNWNGKGGSTIEDKLAPHLNFIILYFLLCVCVCVTKSCEPSI